MKKVWGFAVNVNRHQLSFKIILSECSARLKNAEWCEYGASMMDKAMKDSPLWESMVYQRIKEVLKNNSDYILEPYREAIKDELID